MEITKEYLEKLSYESLLKLYDQYNNFVAMAARYDINMWLGANDILNMISAEMDRREGKVEEPAKAKKRKKD